MIIENHNDMKNLVNQILMAMLLLPILSFQDEGIKFNPEKKIFIFEANKKIKISETDNGYLPVTVESGKNWVFKYQFRAKESEMIADDEYTEYLLLEIPPQSGKSFRVTGDLSKYNIVFSKSCFCRDSGPRQVKAGFMKGRKTNKGWEIELRLMVPNRDGKESPTEKIIKGLFVKGEVNGNE